MGGRRPVSRAISERQLPSNAEQRVAETSMLRDEKCLTPMSSFLQPEQTGGCPDSPLERTSWTTAAHAEALIDAELVRCFNAGDEDAFAEIVRRHRRRIFNAVVGCLRDRGDVEEIVNDTFLRAYRGLSAFRGESSLATWLYHIALNLARNRYWYVFRRRHLAASLNQPVSSDGTLTQADLVASDSPDPSEVLDRGEFHGLITTCLARMPAPQRELLQSRGLLENSYEKIAAQLGLGVATVKSRIARARRILRRTLEAASPEKRGAEANPSRRISAALRHAR